MRVRVKMKMGWGWGWDSNWAGMGWDGLAGGLNSALALRIWGKQAS